MKASIYEGEVVHQRFQPRAHRLNYHIFQMLLDLDRLDADLRPLRFLSRNRFNLFGFYDRDFGPDKASAGQATLKARVEAMLMERGLHADGDRIFLMTMPRVLGFVFNPISLYFVQGADDHLKAVVYEVNNTFGDRHSYVLPVVADERPIRQRSDKRLHVSPFMDMDMAYDFDLIAPDDRFGLRIDLKKKQADGFERYLFAGFTAERRPLADATLMRLFFAMPLMTLKVVLGIHWEALLLASKGLRLKPKPPTERSSVSLGV